MKHVFLITNKELENIPQTDLKVLFNVTSRHLMRSARGSSARTNALANLENISRAMADQGV